MTRWSRRSGARVPQMMLQCQMTERCNQHCSHCYQDDIPIRELGLDAWLGLLGQFRELLQAMGHSAGVDSARGHLTVSGGEPFVRADTLDFLESAAAMRPRLSLAVLTNGSLVDDAVARRLRRLNLRFVQVSLDGTPATHDRMRGPGNHQQTVAAIRRLRRCGIAVVISFTASRDNYCEFADVASLAARLGAVRVWADRQLPMGRGATTRTLLPDEAQAFFRMMGAARKRARSHLWRRTEVPMHRALQFLEGGRRYRCTAGRSLLAVQPDGTVYPCRRLPIPVGNFTEASLVGIYRQNQVLSELRDESRVPSGCADCGHLPKCRGGLRCLAWAQMGQLWEADPGCWLAAR